MRLQFSILSLTVVSMWSIGAAAQMPPEPPPMAIGGEMGQMAVQGKATMVTMGFEGMDASPVKGAPFCANISTEHTQQFADGNRIHTTNTSVLCRDGEGRIRRESDLNFLGAVPEGATDRKLVTIIDPVAGFRYVLDTKEKTARKMPLMLPKHIGAGVKGGPGPETAPADGQVFQYRVEGAGGPGTANAFYIARRGKDAEGPAPTTENLGDQTINGIHATGTRISTTIAAGKMGNESPIHVTSEHWYSPELKATVMTKHSDPWAGELKTQFTNVNTSEPDASLFTVPSDFTISNEKAMPFVIHKKVLSEPPPPSPE
jgi:hypothetical protein